MSTIRLYRGEAVPSGTRNVPEWVKATPYFQSMLDASGRWFTTDLSEAQMYALDAGEGHRIVYVDVPDQVSEMYRASAHPKAKFFVHKSKPFTNDERFLPREIAAIALPLTLT